jgi:hypothetical protein
MISELLAMVFMEEMRMHIPKTIFGPGTPPFNPGAPPAISWGDVGDALFNALRLPGIVNIDPRTPGLGDGFGSGFSAAPQDGQTQNRPLSACGRFVNILLAAGGISYAKIRGREQKALEAGHDLMFNIAHDAAKNLAADNSNDQEWNGFRERFVTPPQRAGVKQHIASHAGAYLIGNGCLLPFCIPYNFPGLADGVRVSTGAQWTEKALEEDQRQLANPTPLHTVPEAEAEIAADYAGREIGNLLRDYHLEKEKETYEATRGKIIDILCINGGFQ